jgi:hypothetical protein
VAIPALEPHEQAVGLEVLGAARALLEALDEQEALRLVVRERRQRRPGDREREGAAIADAPAAGSSDVAALAPSPAQSRGRASPLGSASLRAPSLDDDDDRLLVAPVGAQAFVQVRRELARYDAVHGARAHEATGSV